jgi:hypothetical protein
MVFSAELRARSHKLTRSLCRSPRLRSAEKTMKDLPADQLTTRPNKSQQKRTRHE